MSKCDYIGVSLIVLSEFTSYDVGVGTENFPYRPDRLLRDEAA